MTAGSISNAPVAGETEKSSIKRELEALRLRLRTIEAEHEEERLQTRARTLFTGLIAIAVLVGLAVTWLARSLGFDVVVVTSSAVQLALAITILGSVVIAVAVLLQLREADQRRADRKRLLTLETALAANEKIHG